MKYQGLGIAAIYAVHGVQAQSVASTTTSSVPAEITGCHYHGSEQYCLADGVEGSVVGAPIATEDGQSSYTGCHTHSTETFCLDDNGEEVQFVVESGETSTEGSVSEEQHSHEHSESDSTGETATQTPSTVASIVTDCHYHGTVQYCMAGDVEGSIVGAPTASESGQASYTGCHTHSSETYCLDSSGEEVQFAAEVEEASSTATDTATASVTSMPSVVTGCHYHDTTQYCMAGDIEGEMVGAPTVTSEGQTTYTGCHIDASETYCLDDNGEELQFVVESTNASSETTDSSSGENCHFHAGVEHCTGGSSETSCERTERDYDIPLRIGLLFVILVTSGLGSLGPLFINKLFKLSMENIIFVILKQFGTGIIISTAFVHLITHANLMWVNDCIGDVGYEATGAAITMAGLFLAFIIEYVANRLMQWRNSTLQQKDTIEAGPELSTVSANDEGSVESEQKNTSRSKAEDVQHMDHHSHGLLHPDDKISVLTMEAGIIFHSILIGITLVVAGDSYFITLFIVILFHQLFEGIALGSRIAQLENTTFWMKFIMGSVFAVITPIGMAIGIGVLSQFNGSDRSTLIALGTLDSFSAGVLIWTGVVEMWAHDWLFGTLAAASLWKTSCALFSLIVGMIVMSVLGNWA